MPVVLTAFVPSGITAGKGQYNGRIPSETAFLPPYFVFDLKLAQLTALKELAGMVVATLLKNKRRDIKIAFVL